MSRSTGPLSVTVEVSNSKELNCPQRTTLLLESDLTVQDALEKITRFGIKSKSGLSDSSEGNVPIPIDQLRNYTLFVKKTEDKGILVEDETLLLAALGVADKDTLVLLRKLPYKSFYDMFDITSKRSTNVWSVFHIF